MTNRMLIGALVVALALIGAYDYAVYSSCKCCRINVY